MSERITVSLSWNQRHQFDQMFHEFLILFQASSLMLRQGLNDNLYSKSFNQIILYGQVIVWIIICSAIAYMIFIANSSSWCTFLLVGLCVQIIGIFLNTCRRKLNKTWLTLVLTPLIILSLIYVESRNWIDSHIFDGMQMTIMSILIENVMYFFTITQMIREIRINKKSSS